MKSDITPVTLLIATRNKHKTSDIRYFLHDVCKLQEYFNIIDMTQFPDVPDVEETGKTFGENARLKATAVVGLVPDVIIIGEDSGICVDRLGGAPGLYSARYDGKHWGHAANNAKLLAKLRPANKSEQRIAVMACALFVCTNDWTRTRADTTAKVVGWISKEERGTNGYAYDSLFIPDGSIKTMAEMSTEEKMHFSHRTNALKSVLPHIWSLYKQIQANKNK